MFPGVIKDLSEIEGKSVSITTGSFDGIHLGHLTLLEKLREVSESNGSIPLVITFDPHPRKVIDKCYDLKLLTTKDEKSAVISSRFKTFIHYMNFTEDLANTDSSDFYKNLIFCRVKVRAVVAGRNHSFGRDRKGDGYLLKSLCEENKIKLHFAEPVMYNNRKISSTRIRESIKDGSIMEANTMLGYTYSLSGRVVRGTGIGSKIGFPTANIDLENSLKAIPLSGVYITETILNGKKFRGISNVGKKPTTGDHGVNLENCIFGLDSDIYGSMISVKFIKRLRGEEKFDSLGDLSLKIAEDKRNALLYFGSGGLT